MRGKVKSRPASEKGGITKRRWSRRWAGQPLRKRGKTENEFGTPKALREGKLGDTEGNCPRLKERRIKRKAKRGREKKISTKKILRNDLDAGKPLQRKTVKAGHDVNPRLDHPHQEPGNTEVFVR